MRIDVRYLTVVFISALGYNAAVAQGALLYENVPKGEYDIGYRTIVDFDYSRIYNLNYPADTSSERRDPRPIVINIWYPAKAGSKSKPMHYGDYIKIGTQDGRGANFIKRIEEYNLRNSALYMFYDDSLSEHQKKQLTNQLNEPIKVYRNATPVAGKFPLVIYHAGLGGTLNDNTVLCEALASHGFVVVTSAFQNSDFRNVNLNWDLDRSTKDIDFMLNRIKVLPFIDFSKVAAIGHSFGAQAVLGYRTEDYSPVSWLIILDTTMDYSLDANPKGFEILTEKLYRKIRNMDIPILAFANPNATFRVLDSLQYSDRMYATVDLGHNDFTSLTALARKNGFTKQDPSDSTWIKYTGVLNYSLNYLKSNINNDPVAKASLFYRRYGVNVTSVARGSKLSAKIPEYSDFSKPPSRLQFDQMVMDGKFGALDEVFKLYPRNWSEDYINNTGYELMEKNIDGALYLFIKNTELHPQSSNVWDSLGEAYMIKGEKALAIQYYLKSIELNPKNENGLRMLKKLGHQ